MYSSVTFNMPESRYHSMPHCERVLLYALMLAEKICGNDESSLTILSHAAVFHDSRREDDGTDIGHGARAAEYYASYCRGQSDIRLYPEAACLMICHDRPDGQGLDFICKRLPKKAEEVSLLYRIFKDADALDRWRLGRYALNPDFLRTREAEALVGFARKLVELTHQPI